MEDFCGDAHGIVSSTWLDAVTGKAFREPTDPTEYLSSNLLISSVKSYPPN